MHTFATQWVIFFYFKTHLYFENSYFSHTARRVNNSKTLLKLFFLPSQSRFVFLFEKKKKKKKKKKSRHDAYSTEVLQTHKRHVLSCVKQLGLAKTSSSRIVACPGSFYDLCEMFEMKPLFYVIHMQLILLIRLQKHGYAK